MPTKFFTNQAKNTLFNKLVGIFKHNQNINHFDVLVGYFRSSGYFKLRPLLEHVANIRILVGINVDELTQKSHALGLIYKENKEKVEQSWQEQFTTDIKQAKYDAQTEQGVKQFIQDMLSGKVSLKAHPSQKIHAKIYIFRPDNFNEHTASSVITGSSNLTDAGLGTQQTANYEFNVLLSDYDEVKFATDEFEKLWLEGIDIPPEVAENSLKKTHLADDITPYELYLKMLIEYFGDEINDIDITDLPNGFKKLSYQADAVHQGLLLLKKHNGFFLADVVGLGKTVIATLIARKFWYDSGRDCAILVITPPAIKPNWKDTFKKFNFNANIKIITNGSIDKIKKNNYDLIIVDEAHKFRNDTTEAYAQLQKLCKKVYLNADGKIIVKKSKVILISATPLNNKPDDIFNQVLLFQDKNYTTLEVALGDFFVKHRSKYTEIKKHNNNKQEISALYEEIRKQVIQPLMVRRTRTDLTTIDRYKKDLEKQNIVFPVIEKPQPIYYQLEKNLNALFDKTLQQINPSKEDEQGNKGLLYTRYQAIHFLKPKLKKDYKNAEAMAIGLKGIMKTLLLKRMDSSFYAFNKTLNNFLASSQAMLEMIEKDTIIISADKKILEYILDDDIKGALDLEDKKEGVDYIKCSKDDFEDGFVIGVEHDHKILKYLVHQWGSNKLDPKIDEFKKQLANLLNKANNPEQKLVIFTESVDTMQYLSDSIQNDYKILSVSGENRDKLKGIIKENFDANIKAQDKKNDYQLIITTDVLAEGINLHRANTILNYDTPWNATKLMQRIGRVNRIGSTAKEILIYNFYPTKEINDAIALEQNAKTKMQGFHSALGEDSQIYSPDEQTGTFGIFDKDIQDDKDERLVFLEEIKQFKKDNYKRYATLENKPSKLRNSIKNQYYDSTLSFIRTADNQSMRFYFNNNKTIEPWTFIQSAQLLKCDESAKAEKNLPENHHNQVLENVKVFKEEQDKICVVTNQTSTIDTKTTNLIKQFLEPVLKIENIINSEQINKINAGIDILKQGVFQDLSKQLQKLQKNVQKNQIALNDSPLKIVEVIDEFIIKNQQIQTIKKATINKTPNVVISQSYV